MEKILIKMKLENVSMSEPAWNTIDLILTSEKIPRDLFLGALINAGLTCVAKDMKSLAEGNPIEDVLKRICKEKGISETKAKEIDETVEEDGIEGCFKRTV